ncbi:hypothetical protein Tco_1068957 [Tanacetum coccineum]|uniref:Uncharacterized protein n=1 Tax=Tanacetum coccineum TaxID=301880 RepID=A0ABQ5HJ30_9ASTR
MESYVDTLMKDAILIMGRSENVFRISTDMMPQLPLELLHQEAFEDLVMNFILDQEEKVKTDNLNITIEEYIRLEEENARRNAIAFNDTLMPEVALSYEPTTSPLNDNKVDFRISFDESDDEDYMVIFDKISFSYKIIYVNDLKSDSENDIGKVDMPSFLSPEPTVCYFDDLDYFKDFEKEFPAIIYNDALTSKLDFLTEPTMSPQHIDEFNLKDETSLSEYDEEEQNVLYFNDLFPFNFDFADMALPPRDHRHPYLRFEGLKYTDAGYTGEGMLMEHMDAQGQSVFTSRAWRLLFEVRGPLEGVRHRMSWREFILGMGLHTMEEMESIGFGAYWAESARQILDKGDLSAYWVGISSMGDFLGTTPSYTSIRDLMLRLCHRLIACNIARRSHAPKKVTMTILFYLRGMDVGLVNIPYILARYLRMFTSGRKRGAMISRGQFVARLAKHFGLLTEQRL